MASTYRYRVVDVFTQTPLEGNALAVFPEAGALDTATMQKIARELNLAETTFVSPSTRADCLCRVRIFTPVREMMFAGHPTIGTAWVLVNEGAAPPREGTFLLEENVGPVPVRVEPDGRIWLTTPPIRSLGVFDADLCAAAIGLQPADLLPGAAPELLTAGNPTLFIPVRSKQLVDASWLSQEGAQRLRPESMPDPFCVFVFTPTEEGAYSRMFAPEYGIAEDPATGSSTGPLAVFLKKHALVSRDSFVSEQGTKMGRRSMLYVRMSEGDVLVGGHVAPLAEARMTL